MRAYPDHYFVLNKNITISGQWVPIEVFNGYLNGNHKSIHNLTNTFIVTNNGTISNLNLKDVNINDFRLLHIGSLSKFNYGRLTHINVSGEIYGYEDMAGLTYYNNGLIEGATINMNVRSNRFAGGIADINGPEGVIKKSFFNGKVSNSGGAGGIVYDNRGLIKDSIARGSVSIECCIAGGIAGDNSGVIMNVIAAADVHFTQDSKTIGKVAGYNMSNGQIIRPIVLNHIYKNGVLVE
ncbi:MAG: hypothetical protein J7559_14475, partial [Cohnella sp.]|nr:hypothetical protein [Cohnella sp.]